jgi:hypothetical protein
MNLESEVLEVPCDGRGCLFFLAREFGVGVKMTIEVFVRFQIGAVLVQERLEARVLCCVGGYSRDCFVQERIYCLTWDLHIECLFSMMGFRKMCLVPESGEDGGVLRVGQSALS